jgi:hypothetical protein
VERILRLGVSFGDVLGELIVHFSECLTTDEQDKVNWMRVDGTDKLSMDRDQLPRPLLVFDGDCSFCWAWVEYWKDSTGNRVDYSPFQEVGECVASAVRVSSQTHLAGWRGAKRGSRRLSTCSAAQFCDGSICERG